MTTALRPASALVLFFRFAVGVVIGMGVGLGVLVLYFPRPRSIVAGLFAGLFRNDWMAAGMAFLLILTGVWLALQQVSRKERILWAGVFLLLGAGVVIANLSLVSKSRVDRALRTAQQDLASKVMMQSTASLERLVTLQKELLATQHKLIRATQSIVQEGRNRTTAGLAYCVLVPAPRSAIPESISEMALPLQAGNPSRYALIGATATIEEQGRSGEAIEQVQDHLRNAATIKIGDIGPLSEKPIPYSVTARKDRDNYFHIAIYSEYVLLTELLVVSWNNGKWNADWSLVRTGDSQWIHQVAEDFPYVERPK